MTHRVGTLRNIHKLADDIRGTRCPLPTLLSNQQEYGHRCNSLQTRMSKKEKFPHAHIFIPLHMNLSLSDPPPHTKKEKAMILSSAHLQRTYLTKKKSACHSPLTSEASADSITSSLFLAAGRLQRCYNQPQCRRHRYLC